jgi:hypothetical protein
MIPSSKVITSLWSFSNSVKSFSSTPEAKRGLMSVGLKPNDFSISFA